MNENENKDINVEEISDDEKQDTPVVDVENNGEEKPEPPVFDGKDDTETDTNDLTQPSTNPATPTANFDTSTIFGLVKSMFSSITSQFNLSFNFGNFFNAPFMQGFNRFMPGGFNQPQMGMWQQTMRGGFAPQPMQNFFGTQTQFSYTSKSSTVMTLDANGDKEVWLNENSEEVTINATETTGSNILAGNNKDNQIFGGRGHNEMWGGGYKTNDYLFGGEGQNVFWYGKGEGIDLVENAKSGDTINLYNITLGDISNVEITDSSISLVVGEEGIAVNNSDTISPNFKLADGETYQYNRSSAEWQKA